MSTVPLELLHLRYERYAQEYLRSLPLEHFREATTQATQREITVTSLALVQAKRPDIQRFNELLVQYPRKGHERPGQVVPDNMVVVWDQPIKAVGSFNTPLQPVGPFWVLEYVSKGNERKDYDDNMEKYEKELKVPYYLLFAPELEQLTLFRRGRNKYVSVKPNDEERYPIEELEIEVALVEGWVRFWFRGTMLPLPAELQAELDNTREELRQQRRRANRAEKQAALESEARQAAELANQEKDEEMARLREELERLRNQQS